MFRIRKVMDDVLPINIKAIRQAQEILRTQFRLLSSQEIEKLPEQIRNPIKYRFQAILFVADTPGSTRNGGSIRGFALMLHAPDLRFSFLDYISTEPFARSRGFGGALYARVREEALLLNSTGLFFECLPDDPKLCKDPVVLKQNSLRLKFYEKHGARPLINTAYETPLKPEGDNPPYLVYDGLGRDRTLSRDEARAIVKAILERKYAKVCPPGYINMVVESFKDDPVQIRPLKYARALQPKEVRLKVYPIDRIALVINDRHDIHHVKEHGYVESPVRIASIMTEINKTEIFENMGPHHFSEHYITSVHDKGYYSFFKRVCQSLPEGESVYPYVFPLRNAAKPPKELLMRAGYYCIDTFTPLNRNAFVAASRAVDCALTAARMILEGHRTAYALVRPPGHHAEVRTFGGFCYFNSAALAANYLTAFGKVAVLDVDYHHGNGTQDIFYQRGDVLTVSIHGHPNIAYPYFSGFEEEVGTGPGEGLNLNIPLQDNLEGPRYMKHLEYAIRKIHRFGPRFLVVSLGLDTAKGDPTGSWLLLPADFEAMGNLLGGMRLPVLIVQEGGYDTDMLGTNAISFFNGLWSKLHSR